MSSSNVTHSFRGRTKKPPTCLLHPPQNPGKMMDTVNLHGVRFSSLFSLYPLPSHFRLSQLHLSHLPRSHLHLSHLFFSSYFPLSSFFWFPSYLHGVECVLVLSGAFPLFPFEFVKVFAQKEYWVVRSGHAQLNDAVLEQSVDLMFGDVGFAFFDAGLGQTEGGGGGSVPWSRWWWRAVTRCRHNENWNFLNKFFFQLSPLNQTHTHTERPSTRA